MVQLLPKAVVAVQKVALVPLLVLGSQWQIAWQTMRAEPERGAVDARIMAIIMGVITIVVGLVMSDVVLSQAATSGADANIGSFTGARSFNDLVPVIYFAALVIISVGLIGLGAAGLAGSGPMRKRSR